MRRKFAVPVILAFLSMAVWGERTHATPPFEWSPTDEYENSGDDDQPGATLRASEPMGSFQVDREDRPESNVRSAPSTSDGSQVIPSTSLKSKVAKWMRWVVERTGLQTTE